MKNSTPRFYSCPLCGSKAPMDQVVSHWAKVHPRRLNDSWAPAVVRETLAKGKANAALKLPPESFQPAWYRPGRPTFTPGWVGKLLSRGSGITSHPARVRTGAVGGLSSLAEPNAPSLGEAVRKAGATVAVTRQAGMTVRHESAPCTCGGLNENCFRCDGTGYYARQVVQSYVPPDPVSEIRKHGARAQPPQVAGFSNDPRGAARAVREQGRFDSLPLHDDHDS